MFQAFPGTVLKKLQLLNDQLCYSKNGTKEMGSECIYNVWHRFASSFLAQFQLVSTEDKFNAGSKGYAQEMLGRSSCSKVAAGAPRGEMYHILHRLYGLHHCCHAAYHELWEQTCGEGVNSPVKTGLKDLCERHLQAAKLFGLFWSHNYVTLCVGSKRNDPDYTAASLEAESLLSNSTP